MKPKIIHNWFSALLMPFSANTEAAYCLLASGTAPPLDVRGLIDGVPVIGLIANTCQEYSLWNQIERNKEASIKEWIDGFDPLQLSEHDPKPKIPVMPQANGQFENPEQDFKENLTVQEALFASLLSMGADPWTSWDGPHGKADGFDLAMAWGCLPLIDACLRHPNRPDLKHLHKRTPWTLRQPIGWEEKGRGVFGKGDTLLSTTALAGQQKITTLLIENGWDINPKTGRYKPLELARTEEIVKTLLQHGATWENNTVEKWKALSKNHNALRQNLAVKVGSVGSLDGLTDEQIKINNEALSLEALKALVQKEWKHLSDVLTIIHSEDDGTQKKGDNGLLKIQYAATAWMKASPIIIPGCIKPTTASPLLGVAMLALKNSDTTWLIAALNKLGPVEQINPQFEIFDGVSVRGLALLVFELSKKKGINLIAKDTTWQAEKWVEHINQLDPQERFKLTTETAISLFNTLKPSYQKNIITAFETATSTFAKTISQTEISDVFKNYKDAFLMLGIPDNAKDIIGNWIDDQPISKHLEWSDVLYSGKMVRNLETLIRKVIHHKSEIMNSEPMQQHVDQLLMRWKEDHEKGLLDSKWQTVNAGFNRIQLECIHDEHSPIKNLANNRVKI